MRIVVLDNHPLTSKTPMSKTMKKTTRPNARDDVRTTVSFSKKIWSMAAKQMKLGGFNDNVSAYLAHCIREDRRRSVELELAALELSRATGEQQPKANAVARRIIDEILKTARDRSRDESASAYEILQTGVSPQREILGFSPRPAPPRPSVSPAPHAPGDRMEPVALPCPAE
jgi:hypothetical protein